VARIKEIVGKRRRWGLVRIHNSLKNEGLVINLKRTERIYRQEGLQIRKRARKKLARVPRVVRPRASRPNEVWSIDFVFDWLMTRRKLKCLTVIDDFTKQSVGILVGHSISGAEVARYLESLGPKPDRIRSDNGPEFVSMALINWLHDAGIEHETITPGKPNENAYIESFNSRFRDECLNEHVFRDLTDAKRKIEDWRKDYNENHPHSSLDMKTPNGFADQWSQCYQPPINAT
jgi:putative transposase